MAGIIAIPRPRWLDFRLLFPKSPRASTPLPRRSSAARARPSTAVRTSRNVMPAHPQHRLTTADYRMVLDDTKLIVSTVEHFSV